MAGERARAGVVAPGEIYIISPVAEAYEEEARRLAKIIGVVCRLTGRSLESLEEPTGLSAASLRALFDGIVKLEVTDIFRLAKALDIHPSDFFLLASPKRPVPRMSSRELIRKVQEALGLPLTEGKGDSREDGLD